jgi:hypothetical protein
VSDRFGPERNEPSRVGAGGGSHLAARPPRWGRRIGLTLALVVAVGLMPLIADQADPAVSITVDFAERTVATPRTNIGFTATTFAVDGGTVVSNAGDASALGRLGAGAVRIHLRRGPDGSVVTGAAGGDQAVPADRWLQAYEQMGLAPTVVLDLDRDGALAVLHHLRLAGHDVRRYVIGNEMDANSRADVSAEEYVRRFTEIATAMREVDPSLEIGGPAPADFEGLDQSLVAGLVQAPRAGRASFIDFHAYGAGEGEQATMPSSWRYGGQLDRLRDMIGERSVGLQVGEYNLNWADEPQNNTQAQSVWVAAALGTILSRGAVAFQYGDKNQAMGLVAGGVPKASYWGMAAFTGAGLFRPFGTTMVRADSDEPAVRVFASADESNVVIINTGPDRPAWLRLNGFAGGHTAVWQDTAGQFDRIGQLALASRSELQLPAMSVTVLVLDEGRKN